MTQEEKFDIPEGMTEICTAIVMERVSVDTIVGAISFAMKQSAEAKDDDSKLGIIIAFAYSLMSYGYYLGSKEALETLIDMAEEWSTKGKPDGFIEQMLKDRFGKN